MVPITAGQLYDRIAAVHAPPEWACFSDVANGTGSTSRRRADALAMGLWPSRGMVIRGFEIKVSRYDYRREAADPMKAETIATFCDEWWIVAPEGLIEDPSVELPPAWGLMVPNEKRPLRTVRAATSTKAAPITRAFLGAILRAAHRMTTEGLSDYIRRDSIEKELEKAREQGVAEAPVRLGWVQAELGKHQKALAAWKEATGIDLLADGWNDKTEWYAEACRVGSAFVGEYKTHLPNAVNHVEGAVNILMSTLTGLRALLSGQQKKE